MSEQKPILEYGKPRTRSAGKSSKWIFCLAGLLLIGSWCTFALWMDGTDLNIGREWHERFLLTSGALLALAAASVVIAAINLINGGHGQPLTPYRPRAPLPDDGARRSRE